MLALCLMFSKTYYAQNYAGIIGLDLCTIIQPKTFEHYIQFLEVPIIPTLNVTEFWKTNQTVTLDLFHFIGPVNRHSFTMHSQWHYQAQLIGLLFQSRFCQPCKVTTETIRPMIAVHGRHGSEIDSSGSEACLRPSRHAWTYGWHFLDSYLVKIVLTEGTTHLRLFIHSTPCTCHL